MEFLSFLLPIHMEIYETLIKANVIVEEHHISCGTQKKWDGWVLSTKDKLNKYNRTVVAICTDTMKHVYEDWQGEINRTLAHEAIHVAQLCKSKDGHVRPLGFRDDVEKEAFAVQDNPREVLRILKKYCL